MTAPRSTGGRSTLGLVLALLAVAVLWWTQGEDGSSPASTATDTSSAEASVDPSRGPTATGTPSSGTPSSGPSGSPAPNTDPESGLPLILESDLPAAAREVLRRIEAGGPFDFPERDGGVFENREGLLPDRPLGHYREYTVDDGVGDRGPLRIVAGADGERYWTTDHYRSFSRVEVGG